MRPFYNIEPSAFHRGEYVGFSAGKVFRVFKRDKHWRAVCNDIRVATATGRTLADISAKLTALEPMVTW